MRSQEDTGLNNNIASLWFATFFTSTNLSMQSQQSDQNARGAVKKYDRSRRNESEQGITRVREEEHKHISSVHSLQATSTPPKNHVVSQWDVLQASKQEKMEGCARHLHPHRPLIVLSSLTILQHATCLELVPRVYYLYTQALICVRCNGP